MQQNLNEHRRLKYLQAMGIPVWVQRLPGDEVVEAALTSPIVSHNVPDIPQKPVSNVQRIRRECRGCKRH